MTPQNTHKDDWKLLLAIGGFVIVGAAAIAVVAGLGADEEARKSRQSTAPSARVVEPSGRTATVQATAQPASLEKIGGSTVGPEVLSAIENEDLPAAEEAYPVDLEADLAAVGAAAFACGEYEKAAAYWKADAERRPERAYSHYMLGLAQWKAGRLDEAAESLRVSGELNPKSIRTFVNLSRVLNARGEYDAALEAAEAARKIDPEHPQALYLQARSLYNLQRQDDAVVALEQALAFDSEYGHAYNLLGLIRIQQGRAAEAVDSLRLAATHEPGVAFVHANLGRALELNGSTVEAADAFRAALALDAEQATAIVGLARVESAVPEEQPASEPTEAEAVAAIDESQQVAEDDEAAGEDGTLQ
jgi:tetratricopeptide (TPR) repeat protein